MNVSKEEIKELFEEILDSRAYERSAEHAEQHEWIKARIEAEKNRQEFYREGVKTLIQWSFPAIAASIWLWFDGHWK